MGRHGDNLLATSILINNRDMTKLPAGLFNQLSVIAGIHQIIEVGHLVTGHFDQWNRHLAVMERGRGDQGTDRQANIIGIQMQLVAVP